MSKGKASESPMLAAEGVLGKITYPVFVSDKFNGVRVFVKDDVVWARSMKPIPNLHVQRLFGHTRYNGLDAEIVVGPYGADDVFTRTTSGVMTEEGTLDVRLYCFDKWDAPGPFQNRIGFLRDQVRAIDYARCIFVPHEKVYDDATVKARHDVAISKGLEGLVIRDANELYKWGRSTAKEQGFMRYCEWRRSEAEIIEVLEGETNTNEKTTNELGFAKRSHHKAGKVKTGVAGACRVRDLVTGVIFKIPVGGDEFKAWMWENRVEVVGRILKYKYRPSVKIAPRFPQIEGFRDPLDM